MCFHESYTEPGVVLLGENNTVLDDHSTPTIVVRSGSLSRPSDGHGFRSLVSPYSIFRNGVRSEDSSTFQSNDCVPRHKLLCR